MISARHLARMARRGPEVISRLIRWGAPARSLLFGPKSLGDDLLCTAVLREARERGEPRVVFSNRPELFEQNDDPLAVLPIDDDYLGMLRRLGRPPVKPYYVQQDPQEPDRDLFPSRHIIAEMCALAGLRGAVRLRPYLQLRAAERRFGRFARQQITIQSSGLGAALPYQTKEWFSERFAAVCDAVRSSYCLVQVGSACDPALPVHHDLRGRTSLRQTAAVLANSSVFLGLEGFLMHLARAVDCRATIVFGGRSRPETFGYVGNVALITAPPCSPCGLRNTCPHDRVCMQAITAGEVIGAVVGLASEPPSELPVATVQIP